MWYRGISLIRECFTLGSYRRSMPPSKVLGGGRFLMTEVPL